MSVPLAIIRRSAGENGNSYKAYLKTNLEFFRSCSVFTDSVFMLSLLLCLHAFTTLVSY